MMEIPQEVSTGMAGGALAVLATAAAIWRVQIREVAGIFVQVLLRRDGDRPSQRERDNRRDDIDQVRQKLDNIAERVRALEEKATAWKAATVSSNNEVYALQTEVQRIASRIGIDMDGLRDLLLEVLKRTR